MNIKNFGEISKESISLVGGKGASLGEMVSVGIPVPSGFVITTEGFQKDIGQEALEAFDQLKVEKVAVRSSAVAEDSLTASWAGQLETYLNVTREDLINKVKECWNSINSERAKDYASQQNLPEDQMKVAVVVQKMVDVKSAGVMFTVNPISEDKKEVMIESTSGLGEKLVQGEIIPDNFLINKESLEIISKDLSEKDRQTVSDEDIEKLVELGKRIEEHYGKPQDIEWAIDTANKIWILQSRPITTL